MKKGMLFLLLLLFSTNMMAQKVKFKKGVVSVNKKELYKITKTKEGNKSEGELPHYAFTDLNGKELLVFTDTTIYFKKLANELKPRIAAINFQIFSPDLNKKVMVPRFAAFSFGKQITRTLKGAGFFKVNKMEEEVFDSFADNLNIGKAYDMQIHIDSTNIIRVTNYNNTKEKYGALQLRKPSIPYVSSKLEIREGTHTLGKIEPIRSGTHAKTFKILNKEGYTIGTAALFNDKNNGNIRSHADDIFRTKYFKRDSFGKELTIYDKLTELIKQFVEQGYL